MKNKIDIDNLQQIESSEESANIDAIFSSIENLSSEISDLGIDFQFDRSIFDESIESKDKEAFMEGLEAIREELISIKSQIKGNNKLKKKIGKICYQDLKFLDKKDGGFINKYLKIFLMSLFLSLSSLGFSEDVDYGDLNTVQEAASFDIDHELYKDNLTSSYTDDYGYTTNYYDYNGITIVEYLSNHIGDNNDDGFLYKKSIEKDYEHFSFHYSSDNNQIWNFYVDTEGDDYEYSYNYDGGVWAKTKFYDSQSVSVTENFYSDGSSSLYVSGNSHAMFELYMSDEEFKKDFDRVDEKDLSYLYLYSFSLDEIVSYLDKTDESICKFIDKFSLDKDTIKDFFTYNLEASAYLNKDSSKAEKIDYFKKLNNIIFNDKYLLDFKDDFKAQYYLDQIFIATSSDKFSLDNIKNYFNENLSEIKDNRDLLLLMLEKFDSLLYHYYDKKIIGDVEQINNISVEDIFSNVYNYYSTSLQAENIGICSNISVATAKMASVFGFKPFVVSTDLHALVCIQSDNYINLVTWGISGEPSYEKISLDDLSEKIHDITGAIGFYDLRISDDGSNYIIVKESDVGNGDLINKLINQKRDIEKYVFDGFTTDLNLSNLDKKVHSSNIEILPNTQVFYSELIKPSGILQDFKSFGFINLLDFDYLKDMGLRSSILSSCFIYNSLIKKVNRSNGVVDFEDYRVASYDLKAKLEQTIFSFKDISNIINLDLNLGFLYQEQEQFFSHNITGNEVDYFNFDPLVKIDSSLKLHDFAFLFNLAYMFKISTAPTLSAMGSSDDNASSTYLPRGLFARNIISSQTSFKSNVLDVDLSSVFELQQGANFYEVTVDAMLKNDILKSVTGGGFKLNIDQLTQRGKNLMPMVKDISITDEFYLSEKLKDVEFVLKIKNLLADSESTKADREVSFYIKFN